MEIQNSIKNLEIWNNEISIETIKGGITNQNFLVTDGSKKYFVRIGKDIPEHLIYRNNEIAASQAASKAGIAPKLVHTNNDIIIFEYIESATYNSELVKKNIDKIINIIKKIHLEAPSFLDGSPPFFWVFQVKNNASFFF